MTRSERKKAKALATSLGCWFEWSHASGWAIRHDSAYIDGNILVGEPSYEQALDLIKSHAAEFRNKVTEDLRWDIERTTGDFPDTVTDEQIVSYLSGIYTACSLEEIREWLPPAENSVELASA